MSRCGFEDCNIRSVLINAGAQECCGFRNLFGCVVLCVLTVVDLSLGVVITKLVIGISLRRLKRFFVVLICIAFGCRVMRQARLFEIMQP